MEEQLKRIILENQNLIANKQLIKRDLPIPDKQQMLIITGARRTGKSCLLYTIAKATEISRILYLDFDDERLIGLHNLKSYDAILDAYSYLHGEAKPLIYFDEIQSLPNWHLYVKRLFSHGYQIVITGSNANLLSREIATYLSGRGIEIKVQPFSFQEFLRLKKIELSSNAQILGKPRLWRLFDEYLLYGGFPEVIASTEKLVTARNILNLLFYKDVIARFNFPEYPLKLIIANITENIGKECTLRKLGNQISNQYQTSQPTFIDYFHALEVPYLIDSIHPYRKSFVQRESRRKVFFLDNSVLTLNSVRKDLGMLLENLVYNTLKRKGLRIFYYRTRNDLEVDFMTFDIKENAQLIQVAYSIANADTRDREIKALLVAMEETKTKHGLILTNREEEVIKIGRYQITVIPVWKWELGLYE